MWRGASDLLTKEHVWWLRLDTDINEVGLPRQSLGIIIHLLLHHHLASPSNQPFALTSSLMDGLGFCCKCFHTEGRIIHPDLNSEYLHVFIPDGWLFYFHFFGFPSSCLDNQKQQVCSHVSHEWEEPNTASSVHPILLLYLREDIFHQTAVMFTK